jgi:hypothetical protein
VASNRPDKPEIEAPRYWRSPGYWIAALRND